MNVSGTTELFGLISTRWWSGRVDVGVKHAHLFHYHVVEARNIEKNLVESKISTL